MDKARERAASSSLDQADKIVYCPALYATVFLVTRWRLMRRRCLTLAAWGIIFVHHLRHYINT